MAAVSSLRCPTCQKSVAFDDPDMPFCSDRCRLIDLGNWASEKYVISTPGPTGEQGENEGEIGEEPQR